MVSKLFVVLGLVVLGGVAFGKDAPKDPKAVVRAFYTDCLTVSKGGDPAATMNRLLADDFKSIGSEDSKDKQHLVGQIQFFWKLVPDLKWEVQDMIVDGNHVVVRSIASGTPVGDFMGMKLDGKKSFKMMTIDIHTVANGQIKQVYHLEDWVTALKQLK
jgi:predicted ester cyclase